MKNWIYIPFLVLMAITYNRVSENFSEISEQSLKQISRLPASVQEEVVEECDNLPQKFNPHALLKKCE